MLKYLSLNSWLLVLLTLPLQGQFNDPNTFGKNRLQYNKKQWRYVESDNFMFYYYDAGYQVATFAAEYAEKNLKDICNAIGHYPLRKIKVFIYTSVNHQQQSNIGIYYQDFDRRGQTSFARAEIEIAYTGNRETFKKKIRLSLADKLIFNMIYGEDFKDVLKNSLLLFLQPWFLSGASKYLAEGWTTEMDDYVRYALSKNYFRRLKQLEKRDAQLIGQAIWNYISIKYDLKQMSNILNIIRITRNEQYALSSQLRVPYRKLIADIEEFYRKQYDEVDKNYILPTQDQIFYKPLGKVHFTSLNFSPDGEHLALGQNRKGALKVKIHPPNKKRRKTIIRRSYQVINQDIGQGSPLIDWRDDSKLGVFIAHREKNFFYSINLKKKRQDERYFRTFSNIQSFQIHPDKGDEFVISGEVNAKSNLYQYFYTDRKLYKLTDGDYEDIDPIYLNNRKGQIIFSSNRPITDRESEEKADLFRNSYNLFLYTPPKVYKPNLLGKVEPLTRTLNINIQPKVLNADELLFLNDNTGIMNLYKYNFQAKTVVQLTNYQQSIKMYTFKENNLYVVFREGSKDVIYKIENFDFERSVFTPQTPRQSLFNSLKVRKIKPKKPEPAPKRPRPKPKKTDWRSDDITKYYRAIPADSVVNQINTDYYIFNYLPQELLPDPTKNYNYDYMSKLGRQRFLRRLQKPDEEVELKNKLPAAPQENIFSRARDYEPEFALDRVDITPFQDPIRGFSFLTQLFMTDIFENHKINVKYFGLTNLKNINIKLEYLYLKKQIDYAFRYEQQNVRQNRTLNAVATAEQIFSSKFEFGMSYPYSVAGSFKLNPLVLLSNFTDPETQTKVRKVHLGYRAEYIFDNTLIFDVNTQEGIKARINYESYFDLNSGNSLGILGFEGRYYYRLNYNITLAGRISGGKYFGNTPHKYAVGGVMNDLLSNTLTNDNSNSVLNSLRGSDLLFARFATNVRGYAVNELVGRNYIISNTELRVPIISYSYRQHITSLFLRYLQLIAFVDMGTAWDRGLPLGRDSYERQNTINNANFNIRVVSYTSPLLVSYGFGVSSYLFGLYLKLEYGFQAPQSSIGSETNSLTHLSIGLNF